MDSMHEIAIAASTSKVFDAWTTREGLRAWWTADVTTPQAEGEPYRFGFDGGTVRFHFLVVEQARGERLRWRGVEAPTMPAEWVGTEIDVHLWPEGDGRTRVTFVHRNWQSTAGAYAACNTTWGELMYRLRDACEGRPRGPLFAG